MFMVTDGLTDKNIQEKLLWDEQEWLEGLLLVSQPWSMDLRKS